MVNDLIRQSSQKIARLLKDLMGFEETGTIPLDCVAFFTRNKLHDLGVI